MIRDIGNAIGIPLHTADCVAGMIASANVSAQVSFSTL